MWILEARGRAMATLSPSAVFWCVLWTLSMIIPCEGHHNHDIALVPHALAGGGHHHQPRLASWNGYDFHTYPHPAKPPGPPRDIMVDVINQLGLKMLAIQNEKNNDNIAISPYGALTVLIALGEGLQGEAVREIQQSARIPNDIAVIRIGLRDIHRHLQSYFIPKEGFLAGLSLNHENVTLRPEYEDVLRFYGFDVLTFNNGLYPPPQTTEKPSFGCTTLPPPGSSTVSSFPNDIPTSAEPITSVTFPPTTTTESMARTMETSSETTTINSQTESTTTTAPTTVSPNLKLTQSTSSITTTTLPSSTTTEQTTTLQVTTSTTTNVPSTSTLATSTTAVTTSVPSTIASRTLETLQTTMGTTSSSLSTLISTQPTTTMISVDITTVGAATEVPDQDQTTQQSSTVRQETEETIEAGTTTPKAIESETVTREDDMESLTTEISTEPITTQKTTTTTSDMLTMQPLEQTSTSTDNPDTTMITTTSNAIMTSTMEPNKDATTTNMADINDLSPTTTTVNPPYPEAAAPTSDAAKMDNEINPTDMSKAIKRSARSQQNKDIIELNVFHKNDHRHHRRRTRSLIDYIIAKYRDNGHHYVRDVGDAVSSYMPQTTQVTFLVHGQFKETDINFMKYDTVLPFTYDPELDALALSFPLDSEHYYLLLVLPLENDGIDRLICDLRLKDNLKFLIDNLRYRHVSATIPSFKLKGYVNLTPTLQKLGIRRVFEPRQADFTPMTKQKDVYVTNIEQAITVNIRNYLDPDAEKYSNLHQFQPVEFKADHPFLYFVLDSELHVTLMAGKVTNPLSSRIS